MIENIIRSRRSVKPSKMNGKIIPTEIIDTMLEMGDWAPTHGRTEPWRFIVADNTAAKKFCAAHAELYKAHTPEEKFLAATYEKLFHQADSISHLIIVYMLPGSNPKIPYAEEVAAVSAAVQNMLLYAWSKQVSSLWSTGGMTHKPALKKMLNLSENAEVSGLLYLGYSDEQPAAKRQIPLNEKIAYYSAE